MSATCYGSAVRDKDADGIVAEQGTGSRHIVNCAYFGTNCKTSCIVPVAVHRGYENRPRPIDLFHRFYVTTSRSSNNGVVKFDEFTIPVASNSELNPTVWNYVIFFSNAVGCAPNTLLRSYPGPRNNLLVNGSVLVAKCNAEGVLAGVVEEDLEGMAGMVVQHHVITRKASKPPQGLYTGMFSVPLRRSSRGRAKLVMSEIVNLPETMVEILYYVDWSTLMHVATLSKYMRACIRLAVKERLCYLLGDFVSRSRFPSLLDLMHRTSCVIVGSVAHRAFTMNTNWYNIDYNNDTNPYNWSYDLNIIAPSGRAEDCQAFFQSIGYSMWYPEALASHYDGVAIAMQRGFLKDQDLKACHLAHTLNMTSDQESMQSIEVTITESTSGVLPVVLASPTTCQLNILSSTTLYTFFPGLSVTNSAICTDISRLTYPRQPHISVALHSNN
ncbi:hypothetical protein BKA70DRAFT_1447940 [Coprinopsis sp. MPI-PUGE-AT-0042]|nr:hypothetical protein BKA70DRAFT_1447940 [Coprinopsis sp. MPI-PUGE-AT-0042]